MNKIYKDLKTDEIICEFNGYDYDYDYEKINYSWEDFKETFNDFLYELPTSTYLLAAGSATRWDGCHTIADGQFLVFNLQ